MTMTEPTGERTGADAGEPWAGDIGRHVGRRRVVTGVAAATCALALVLVLVLLRVGDQSNGLPRSEGSVGVGDHWDDMPDWLVEFVTARGAVPAIPVMADPELQLNETGVVCDGGPDAGDSGWADPINGSTSCTFVFGYVSGPVVERPDGSSSRPAPADICLRHVGTGAPTPCRSELGDPAVPIPGTDYEAVVYRRNYPDVELETLAVSGVSTDWSSLDDTRPAIAGWRVTGSADDN